MTQTETTRPDRDAECDTGVNDNGHPLTNAITLTDLAAAMQVDEDVLLQRLAAILGKRKDVTDADSVKE